MKPIRWSLLLCFVLLFSHFAAGERSLRRVKIQEPDLFPESFDYDRMRDRFLVGSLYQGSISELAADGSFKEFVRDEEYADRAGILEVKVDSQRNRVIVTVTDAVASNYGGVAAYDLVTADRASPGGQQLDYKQDFQK